MALGNTGVDAVLVGSAIPSEQGHRARDLIKQGTALSTVVDLLGCERDSDDLAVAGVQADVQLLPRPARPGAVLFLQPLARAAQAQARAVHQQVQGLATPAPQRARYLQRFGPTAQGRVARHRQSEPDQVLGGAIRF